MKLISLIIIILIFSFSHSLYSDDKIPKPEVSEFNFIKPDDLTKKVQVNLYTGYQPFYWDNEALKKDRAINWIPQNFNIQIGIDKYFLFYNALTFRLSYAHEYRQFSLASGYKLNLYKFIYTKLEFVTQIYTTRYQTGYLHKNTEGLSVEKYSDSLGWDIGVSGTLGSEFTLFNSNFRLMIYPLVLDIMIINDRNLTSLHWKSYMGIGFFF